MPEANADGSATDKFLQNFADNKQEPAAPAAPQTTNVPIHLKITSENGQVQNVEQVSNQNYQPSADEQTLPLTVTKIGPDANQASPDTCVVLEFVDVKARQTMPPLDTVFHLFFN